MSRVPQVVAQDARALNRRDKLVALHHQVYLTLRSELLAGRMPSGGGPLPGENELAERFGVSRATLRRALAALESDGLVVRRHGAGTFPVPPRPHLRRNRSAEAVFGDAREATEQFDREVLSFREVTPPDFVLEVAPGIGSPCLYMCMIARRDGQAVHLNHQYVPLRFAPLLQDARDGNVALLTLLRNKGVRCESIDVNLSASGADLHVATHLGVPVGTPVLINRRISVDAEGRLIECFWAITRPDLYTYTFRFGDGTQPVD